MLDIKHLRPMQAPYEVLPLDPDVGGTFVRQTRWNFPLVES